MLKRWIKESSRIAMENPWWTYRVDRFRIPGGTEGEYHFVDSRGSSMVIPVDGDGRVLLVNQYRFLCDRESLEFPCGGVKPGRTHDAMAAIELEEETGFAADVLEPAGGFNPFNGVTNEMCLVYIARGLRPAERAPDETEEFELRRCTPDEVDALITDGTIWDGMTLAAWCIVRSKLRSDE